MLALTVAVLTLGVGSLARADALGPPRDDCPPGFIGVPPTDHSGGRCVPRECHRDADCGAAPGSSQGTCQATGLCMVHGSATSTCTSIGGACGDPGAGGRCVAAHLCMPMSPPLPPGGPRSALPHRSRDLFALGVPFVCLGFVFRDARRRKR